MKSISLKFDRILYLILLLTVFAILGGTAHAVNNYYVSPSGSGSACTQAAPCVSLSQVHSMLALGSSGDCVAGGGWITVQNVGACVHFLPGNYNGSTVTKQGSASQKIIYISETKWGARFTSRVTFNSGNYSGLFGFDMTAPSDATIIDWESGNHREAQYNNIHDVNACGATGVIKETTAPVDHDTINGNVLHHWGNLSCDHGNHGFYVDGAALTVTNNIISGGCCGWGIQKQYASVTDCTPGIISNNTIFNNQGGMVFNDEGSACGINRWTITNNIIVNNGVSGTGGGGGSSSGIEFWHMSNAPNSLLSNNMVYGNLPANVSCNGSCPTLQNPRSDSSVTATFANFQSDTNASPASNYNQENYQIKASSNAVQSGTTNCATSGLSPCVAVLDIIGLDRLTGALPDIGAYAQQGTVASAPIAPTGLTAVVQ